MKERPILFSGPMVRAILSGAKTQTRRVVKYPERWAHDCAMIDRMDGRIDDPPWPHCLGNNGRYNKLPCPYGQPGDRLWVRETWGIYDASGMRFGYPAGIPKSCPKGHHVSYPADDETGVIGEIFRWRPSIHMRRWMSRITLEIVSVRVERLQDISEADAKAEGVSRVHVELPPSPANDFQGDFMDAWADYGQPGEFAGWGGEAGACFTAKHSFETLWDSINGKQRPGKPDMSWAANPWVWVVEFRRMEGGEG